VKVAKRYGGSIAAVLGIILLAAIGLNRTAAPVALAEPGAGPAPTAPNSGAVLTSATTVNYNTAALSELVKRDPERVIHLAIEHYGKTIRDYTCLFQKQERIDRELRKQEDIAVSYREAPRSVFMVWKKNADQVKRVLFEDGPDYVNKKGEKLARVEPAGALISLVVSDIMMPIHGKRARKTSLRPIDQFGFHAALDMLERDNLFAKDNGDLDLRYDGEGEIDGRPTWKIVRHLPYNGPDSKYPNAKLIVHIDQKWLLPVAVYGYADHEGTELLCSYVYTNVTLNPGLTDRAFEF
jgi:hypothetical protein